MIVERTIAVFVMLSGATIFLARGELATVLPDTLWMRLVLSVGGTAALLLQVLRFFRRRMEK